MQEVLEEKIGVAFLGPISTQGQHTGPDHLSSEPHYSLFAEMFLEKPIYEQAAQVTCTMCTWRGVPTIDDW